LKTTVSNRDQNFEEAGEIIMAELKVYEPERGSRGRDSEFREIVGAAVR
jgi:hypothetical protein